MICLVAVVAIVAIFLIYNYSINKYLYITFSDEDSAGDAARMIGDGVPIKTGACISDNDCGNWQFCEYRGCSAPSGRCVNVPQNCLALWNPVCGCDGRTYSNNCYRRKARVSGAAYGECKKTDEAYFEVKDGWDDTLIIKLISPIRIQEARDILNGKETKKVHVMGTVVKWPADYNPGWSYHLAPFSILFFEGSIEVCDGAFRDIEQYLDEVCGASFPDCLFCPWSSELTREITKNKKRGKSWS